MIPEQQEIIIKQDVFKVFFQVFVNVLEKETADTKSPYDVNQYLLLDLILLYEETIAKYPLQINSRILNIYRNCKNLPVTIQFSEHRRYIESLIEKAIGLLLYTKQKMPLRYSVFATIEDARIETLSFCIYDISFNHVPLTIKNNWRLAYYRKRSSTDRLREGDIMRVRYNPITIHKNEGYIISGKTFFLECFS